MKRVTDLADPRRCKGSTAEGQCLNVAEDGSEYCLVHHGVDRAPARRLRQYLLAQANDRLRLAQFADHEDLKSLRDEIALVRMMIEHTWNSAHSDVEKLQAYSRVNTFLLTLERLLKTCHSLEQSLGNLLGKPALFRLGQQLCHIVVNRLEGVPNFETLVDVIRTDIVAMIAETDNSEANPDEQQTPSSEQALKIS